MEHSTSVTTLPADRSTVILTALLNPTTNGNVEVLRQQLVDGIAAQNARLKSLQEQSSQIDKTLQLISTPDTSAAFDFHNQLTAARLLLEIESGDASFRLEQLKQYLAN